MTKIILPTIILIFTSGPAKEEAVVTDLNQDAVVDSLYKLEEADCGNSGCNYFMKISAGESKYDTATVFLHPSAFRVDKKKNGKNVVTLYLRENSQKGILLRMSISDSPAKVLERSPFHPNGKDSALYKNLFGKKKD